MPDPIPSQREQSWKWLVCGMLLLAGMLNYMDRITLNALAKSIKEEFHLGNDDYGVVGSVFGFGFAFGALGIGYLVDRFGVRSVFPLCVLGWSLAGFLTGFAWNFESLVGFRLMLGIFEAGLTPCALRTTQQILTPQERGMGNSLLQSGPAIGAVITPLVAIWLKNWTGSWRASFWAIGALGIGWAFLWLAVVRKDELPPISRHRPATSAKPSRAEMVVLIRRFIVLVVVVISINLTWHFFRSWLTLFLQSKEAHAHPYTEDEAAYIMSGYYIASDIGTLTAGYAMFTLPHRGWSVHGSRLLVYMACASLAVCAVIAARLGPGPILILTLLVVAFGALGVFPAYYSFSQELTSRHQGKVTGALSFCCWCSVALMELLVGKHVEETKSYTIPIMVGAFLPLVGLAALVLFWGRDPSPNEPEASATVDDPSLTPAARPSAVAQAPDGPYKEPEGTAVKPRGEP